MVLGIIVFALWSNGLVDNVKVWFEKMFFPLLGGSNLGGSSSVRSNVLSSSRMEGVFSFFPFFRV